VTTRRRPTGRSPRWSLAAGSVPRVAVAHLLRARVLRDRAKWSAARNAYERVLHIDPDDEEAIEGLRAIAGLSES
jgi:hypothetical protein